MLDSPILDIALALSFSYFLLGLISSSVNELLLTAGKARSKTLKLAMENLFLDDEWKKTIFPKIESSAFIQALKKKPDHFPAYVPAKNFSLGLISLFRENGELVNPENIRKQLNDPKGPIQGETRDMLLGLLDEAENNMQKFQHGIENMFDNAMDRTSGWFKKRNRLQLGLISLFVTIALNFDSIKVVKSLWNNPENLKQVTALAIEYSKQPIDDESTVVLTTSTDSTSQDTIISSIKNNIKKIKQINIQVDEMKLPIGWKKEGLSENIASITIPTLGGWLVSAIAIFLGAPFWFDLLNKLVNMRGNGKRPKTIDEKDEDKNQ